LIFCSAKADKKRGFAVCEAPFFAEQKFQFFLEKP
jgi:hypothetical protein